MGKGLEGKGREGRGWVRVGKGGRGCGTYFESQEIPSVMTSTKYLRHAEATVNRTRTMFG